MIAALITLASLMGLILAFGMFDGIRIMGAVSGVLAIALMVIAIALPVASLARLTRLLQPVLILVLAAPVLWMLLQIIPMPAGALVNPIWASASAALNQRLAGTITVDVGATLLSLAQYCAVVAAALVTAAIALDRHRAAQVLYILMVVMALVAARQIALELAVFDLPSPGESSDGRAQASVIGVAGILLACATAIHAIDQLQRAGRPRRSRTWVILTLAGALLSLLICAATILVRAHPAVIIAALLGAGTLLAAFAIRRWLLGPWGIAGLAVAVAIGLLGVFAAVPADQNTDPAIALSTQNQTAIERMLSDAAPVGSGGGTFKALLPFYREIGATATSERATAAATILIEMGPAFLCGLIIIALFGAWTLMRRSLARGQDDVYAAAGAGALISLPILAFADDSILSLGASLLTGLVCGLAFAQSVSGAAREAPPVALQTASDQAGHPRLKARSAPSPSFDKTWPRVALALFGLVLTAQAAWILSAERYSQDHLRQSMMQSAVPIDATSDQIKKAATIATVRGDLWAESAFAAVAQPWTDPAVSLDRDSIPEPALNAFTQALHYSPHRGDVWLMLAALAERYRPAGYDSGALLRMSYYTAPNELGLIPLRLWVALRANSGAREPELSEMIKRDISLVLNRHARLRPALVAAYNSAPADSKTFAEHLISEIDPAYLNTMRSQYR